MSSVVTAGILGGVMVSTLAGNATNWCTLIVLLYLNHLLVVYANGVVAFDPLINNAMVLQHLNDVAQ